MFGIYPKSYLEIIQILEKYPSIEKVVIYGSRAKGNAREGSDIDITLFGNPTYQDLSELRDDLEDSYIPYLFDIS
ncbi:MAG TPA: nucleotidyltransferase domain-containing protein, partial [Flavobacterium sp.]|nr:nucleotidyltransferase domain-containing protein [Flavobacterium sp.]